MFSRKPRECSTDWCLGPSHKPGLILGSVFLSGGPISRPRLKGGARGRAARCRKVEMGGVRGPGAGQGVGRQWVRIRDHEAQICDEDDVHHLQKLQMWLPRGSGSHPTWPVLGPKLQSSLYLGLLKLGFAGSVLTDSKEPSAIYGGCVSKADRAYVTVRQPYNPEFPARPSFQTGLTWPEVLPNVYFSK